MLVTHFSVGYSTLERTQLGILQRALQHLRLPLLPVPMGRTAADYIAMLAVQVQYRGLGIAKGFKL